MPDTLSVTIPPASPKGVEKITTTTVPLQPKPQGSSLLKKGSVGEQLQPTIHSVTHPTSPATPRSFVDRVGRPTKTKSFVDRSEHEGGSHPHGK